MHTIPLLIHNRADSRGVAACAIRAVNKWMGDRMRSGRIAGLAAIALAALMLAGCAQRQSQNVYKYDEVGQASAVTFGTIVASREVDITGKNTGTGGLVGAAVGAGAGSYAGSGSGNAWAIGAGLLAGAVAGALIEQAAADRTGVEYVVMLQSGVALTVVQDIGKGESTLPDGMRVMVQNTGGYQRVLPAEALPMQMARPKGIELVD